MIVWLSPHPVGRYTTGQATTECNELKAQVVGGFAGPGWKRFAFAQKPLDPWVDKFRTPPRPLQKWKTLGLAFFFVQKTSFLDGL